MSLEPKVANAPIAEALPAPCHRACPAGIDVPSYLALVAQGRYEEALEVIREENPFPWVCGLICPHPCETACVRGHLDQPVNIRFLKAFVAEWAAKRSGYPKPEPAAPNGYKVAVIGSGPAGLTAAHYLALNGYKVTIFEALPTAGGLLSVGIPEYRLPRDIVKQEISAIESMGVDIITGAMVGRDISFAELRDRGYKAFFLGMGAHRGFKLEIKGEDEFPQIYCAIALLRRDNLEERRKPADKVVVVGGGNSAMDAARTCVRLGCKEVHVAYRRTREEMPANPQEVEEALEEGVQFHFLAIPKEVGGVDGQVAYLECLQAKLGEPDSSGRRRPIPVAGSEFRIEVGAIVTAIGQQPDFRNFSDEIPFKITPRNLIVTDHGSTRTTVEDIFAGGDAATGPATVVEAIAAGKQAALDIHHYISGAGGRAPVFKPQRKRRIPFLSVPASEKMAAGRIPMHLRSPEERKNDYEPVEIGLSEAQARSEASRCLRCDYCIRCGACEAICRDVIQANALELREIGPSERVLCDYNNPKERCIACGSCALACPTKAMELVEDGDFREIRLCGTVLNRVAVEKCEKCGEPLMSAAYLEHVAALSSTDDHIQRRLCPKCARKSRAEGFAGVLR